MSKQLTKAIWEVMANRVTDAMKVYTRPFVTILAGAKDIGTGTFVDRVGPAVLTCEHVARFKPDIYFRDQTGFKHAVPGIWRSDANPAIDMAEAPIPPTEWFKLHTHAQLLPLSRFGIRHQATQSELLFFRGIAGENVKYIGPWGGDVILSGYCSQENQTTSDQNIFEMLWNPSQTALTTGTDEEIKSRIRYNNPEGFSGSLVWNTRFVEKGCDFSSWDPEEAVVTGLLRRYDPTTNTLLVWRVEHLRNWLGI